MLDDSTDDTTALLAEPIGRLRAQGLQVAHLRREARAGFKAGALAAGLHHACGEFIALFDADFVPSPDFLRQTIPSFVDPQVAAVQTRWGHLNRDYSFLTLVQALGLDGHFVVEQPARCWGGLFLHFNGTAGVWRATAIHDAGGWAWDTLTEDLDLSYRAQLCGWRILYRPELVCPAELPVLISGFKAQQCRWAKGCIQTAMKLLPAVLSAPLPVWIKYQACIHLTSYLISPLMLIVVLLMGPLASLQGLTPLTAMLGGMGVVFGLAAFGPGIHARLCTMRHPDAGMATRPMARSAHDHRHWAFLEHQLGHCQHPLDEGAGLRSHPEVRHRARGRHVAGESVRRPSPHGRCGGDRAGPL